MISRQDPQQIPNSCICRRVQEWILEPTNGNASVPVEGMRGRGAGVREPGRTGENGMASVREARKERAKGGIPKLVGRGRNREKLCKLWLVWQWKNGMAGGSLQKWGRNRGQRVLNAEAWTPLPPPQSPPPPPLSLT